MTYNQAMWLGAGATIIYTFLGGFLAVSWTDTLQASLMIFALILTPVMVYLGLGGAEQMAAAMQGVAAETGKQYGSLLAGTTFVGIVSTAAWGLGYFGQPHILVRFMAAASVRHIPNARRIGMTWMVLCLGGAVAVGFVGIAYFAVSPAGADAVNANAETVFMELAKQLFNPWIAGALLAAILAAVMSTLSCQLLVCSSALTEDIYRTFLRKQASQKELVWFGRAMVLVVALIAISIARNPESRVLGMVSYAWAGFGAAFGPVIILSLFCSRITRDGALAGIVTGAVTVLVWKQFGWFGLYEIVPGFILGWAATLGVSRLGRPSAAMLQTHASVEQELARLQVH